MAQLRVDTISPHSSYDVLCLGAHPDDVEMGMGGTVAALTESGRRVAIVSLTAGELGTYGDPQTRAEEALAAAKILGCDLRILDLPDGGVVDDLEARHRLAKLVREIRPSVVFAPYGFSRTGPLDGRSNVDHLAAGRIVSAGCKLARMRKLFPEFEAHSVQRIYSYMLTDTLPPSVIVDVTAQRERFVAAIEAHASQMPISRGERSALDFLLLNRQMFGMRIHVELAEGFLSEDPLQADADCLMKL